MRELIDVISSYPGFMFDFLLVRGFGELYEPGLLSLSLMSALLFSLVIAVLIAMAIPPPAEPKHEVDPRAPAVKNSGPTRRFMEGIFRVTILVAGGPLILHALMELYAKVVTPIDLGNVLDTVNASLAYGAAYLPLHAGAARLRHRVARLSRQPDTTPRFARPTTIGLGLFELAFPIYFLASLSQVHDIPFHVIIRPALVSAVGTIVAVTGVVAIVLLMLRGNPPVQG